MLGSELSEEEPAGGVPAEVPEAGGGVGVGVGLGAWVAEGVGVGVTEGVGVGVGVGESVGGVELVEAEDGSDDTVEVEVSGVGVTVGVGVGFGVVVASDGGVDVGVVLSGAVPPPRLQRVLLPGLSPGQAL